jgi:hypothetical protein
MRELPFDVLEFFGELAHGAPPPHLALVKIVKKWHFL